MGRKPALDSEQRQFVRQLYRSGEFSVREIAVMMRVSRMAIWRYLRSPEVSA